MEKARQVVDSF